MRLFALTGSIGSGKSAAATMLEQLGATIIDADLLAREVVAPGTPGLRSVVSRFGPSVLHADGSLNRQALGRIVFESSSAKEDLEALLHPLISERFYQRLDQLKSELSERSIVICVIPLLFESKLKYPDFEELLVVDAPREVAIQRVVNRDKCSRDLAQKKFDSQISPQEKNRRANTIFDNSGDLERLREQIAIWYSSRA